MNFRVTLSRSADKWLIRLPDAIHARLVRKIKGLQENPLPPGSKKLSGYPGYRIRVGDYRILYTVDTKQRLVHIHDIAHRKDAYRSR